MRLDRFLAEAGAGSRSDVKKLVAKARILVNGEVCRDPARKIDEARDEVCCDGRQITYERFVYFMLNKPQGVISESRRTQSKAKPRDAQDAGVPAHGDAGELANAGYAAGNVAAGSVQAVRIAGDAGGIGNAGTSRVRTCIDLIREETHRDLFPVGRLDKDTEGLLLITDDGQLAHELLSPKKHVDKVYYVELERPLSDEERVKVETGVDIGDDTPTLPARIRMLPDRMPSAGSAETVSQASGRASDGCAPASCALASDSCMRLNSASPSGCALEITIHEGRFHQIKRMFEAVGNKVTFLKRLRMGSLKLDESLAPGEYRRLTPEELTELGS